MPNLFPSPHPLVAHKLSRLRSMTHRPEKISRAGAGNRRINDLRSHG